MLSGDELYDDDVTSGTDEADYWYCSDCGEPFEFCYCGEDDDE